MTCDECDQPTIARQMCSKHYQRWKRQNPDLVKRSEKGIPAIDRLLSRCVEDPETGCWVYTWPTDAKGYVRIRDGKGKQFGHRIAWQYFIGDWPCGLTFDHLCRNKSCVNPWHGEPVPSEVNTDRSETNIGVINRAKTHCPQGHPLDGDNLRYATRGKGRVCRTCRAESSRKYRDRKASA